jgi:lysophospholipase L1-like esterase
MRCHSPITIVLLVLGLLPIRLLAAQPPAPGAEPAAKRPVELKDGDRVLFVGGTFIEREGQFGYIESALTARFADRNITFRNLGQSGDTVLADARNLNSGWANFGPPEQGFQRLMKLVAEYKPTVIIANFGMTESFEGPAKLEQFTKGYEKLLDSMATAAGGSPRMVLLSPNYHEDLGKPFPDPRQHNEHLKLYRDAIRDLAGQRQARFIDLFAITEHLASQGSPRMLTDNGIHPTPEGYRLLTVPLLEAMGLSERQGQSQLSPQQMEKLRRLVVAKNFEFFNYWRPQNDTYILGYRKREQGRNAVEIPQFLPLVEAKEKEIAAAKK